LRFDTRRGGWVVFLIAFLTPGTAALDGAAFFLGAALAAGGTRAGDAGATRAAAALAALAARALARAASLLGLGGARAAAGA